MKVTFGKHGDADVVLEDDLTTVKLSAEQVDELADALADVEPLKTGARVIDSDGDLWTRRPGGLWGWADVTSKSWDDLREEYGPISRMGNRPDPNR